MSKYEEPLLEILKPEQIMSTNEVLKELERQSGKTINWHALYRILNELHTQQKVEKLKTRAGFFWKKKNNTTH